ncbi:PIN domain-containing protein [Acidovorax sp.]|uniref:PIN domain-containing protein n=1 Tax=Acidovorax sp. TaxID=1872122 RepID=UPI00391F5C03
MKALEEISTVVIDANILIKNWHFSGKGINRLMRIKDIYNLDICITAVALEEIIGNYAIQYNEALNVANKALAELDKFGAQKINGDKLKDSTKAKKLFTNRIKKFLKTNDIITIDYPKTSHAEIIQAIYQKKPPFGDQTKEKGYKDYLIIKSLLEYSKNLPEGQSLVLLTENVNDFCAIQEKVPGAHGKKEIQGKFLDAPIELNPVHGSKNIFVAPSSTTLFASLKLKSHESQNLNFFKKSILENSIKDALEKDDSLITMEITGLHTISFKKISATCEIENFKTYVDENIDLIKIDGIARIQVNYDFQADDFDAHVCSKSSPLFRILEKHNEIMLAKGISDWTHDFSNQIIECEIAFSYLDFDYKQKNYSINSKHFLIDKI